MLVPVATDGTDSTDSSAIDPRNQMQILADEACWNLLHQHSLGRLAVSVGGRPEIFPVNYVTHDGRIVFKTAEGTKLLSVVTNAQVAFEIDGYDADSGEAWSVVISGLAHVARNLEEIYADQELALFPWNAAPKDNFVQITPQEISGRRFEVVEDQRPSAPNA